MDPPRPPDVTELKPASQRASPVAQRRYRLSPSHFSGYAVNHRPEGEKFTYGKVVLMLEIPKKPVEFIADVKWDIVGLLLFVPLVSQSINRYFGTEPFLRTLGNLREPIIEMIFLAGIGVFMSIRGTQRLRIIEQLRAAESKYRGVVEDQTEFICRFLPDFKLTFTNQAYCSHFGKSDDKLVGLSFMSFLPQEQAAEIARSIASLNPESPFLTVEHKMSIKGRVRTHRWKIRAVFDPHGKVTEFQAVGSDVTERKQAEDEREMLIETLKEKNTDMDMMNYTISHDLKGPLVTVRGLLKWVERDACNRNLDRLRSNLRIISTAAGRMEQLTDQLSQFILAGSPNQDTEDLDFVGLTREAVELLSGRIIQNGVNIKIPENGPMIKGNRSLLLQVLQNLIENAIKYMGEQSSPTVKIGSRLESFGNVFYVRDNGIGIDASCRESVFNLFNRIDKRIKGCGLGLALVKRAVEAQGGRIWVESEGRGCGSTFCFCFHDSDGTHS